MEHDVGDLARKLAKIQSGLRDDLVEELEDQEDDLEAMLDPYGYSPMVQELREKYLSRLYLIQALLQQLAEISRGQNKRSTRVLSVAADSREELVRRVNRKLSKLNGMKVLDVKFLPGTEEEDWSAVITCEVNPFVTSFDETAAWM
ncbi:MAG: hypothetical protein ACOC7T_03530 [Planctomycetota bacterium]